jgi:extracellular factor (EF) 3-hydroxypalmitic acid methyl ester biosynthesis protein
MFYPCSMSQTLNGNDNGGFSAKAKSAGKPVIPLPSPNSSADSQVIFQTSDSTKLNGVPSSFTKLSAVFEVYGGNTALRASEVLKNFEIRLHGQVIYAGKAVVHSLVNISTKMICEVVLSEADWEISGGKSFSDQPEAVAAEFSRFLKDWQKFYKVSPEFKVVVADMQTMLQDLQLWLNRVELKIHVLPPNERTKAERQLMAEAGKLFVPAFDMLHERMEAISAKVGEDLRPAHRIFIQRQLHPLMLCSPFGHRAYSKPLGYAGDYEMVNMIALDPFQGPTLFAKIVNLWFLSQWPSKAHRNRLNYLKNLLETETLRVCRQHKIQKARIFNFACGPALEVQNFLADFEFCDAAELTLADFNQETLEHLEKVTKAIKARRQIRTALRFQRKNVLQLLKENIRQSDVKPEYDLVYCAGLFDYLPDSTCLQIMEIFYKWLVPGGLLAVTNVVDDRPFRHMLEFLLDWHLIYRDVKTVDSIFPDSIPRENRSVKKDPTGVNIFVEARKPSE